MCFFCKGRKILCLYWHNFSLFFFFKLGWFKERFPPLCLWGRFEDLWCCLLSCWQNLNCLQTEDEGVKACSKVKWWHERPERVYILWRARMQLEKFTRTELAFKGKNRKGKLGVWGRTLWWWGKQNYLSQATWQKLTNVQMLGTLKIKLDKAIVRDNRLQQQEGRFKLFSSSSPWSWLLSWLFLSRKLKVFTDSRELCLYLLPALAILGQFAWQIYEQEQNMRTETAFELYAKSRNNKQKKKFWNKECVREKIKSTSFTLSCKRDVSSIFFGARLNEAIYYRRRWKKAALLWQ